MNTWFVPRTPANHNVAATNRHKLPEKLAFGRTSLYDTAMLGLSNALALGLLVCGTTATATGPVASTQARLSLGPPAAGGTLADPACPGVLDRPDIALDDSGVKPAEGRPQVRLDRLVFPSDVPGSAALKKYLRRILKREVRRVEWGAGRENRIEYRFSVTKLELTRREGVLTVTCSATGSLPGGRTAHSQLTFGGAASQQHGLLRQVLEIVARGVVTRLAQLERQRRGLS